MSQFFPLPLIISAILLMLCFVLFPIWQRRNSMNVKAPAYVINLNIHPDRWVHTKMELNRLDVFRVHRITALDTRKWTKVQFQQEKIPKLDLSALQAVSDGFRVHHHELTSGSVGCFMSHVKTWNTIVDHLVAEDDIAFVFEDDIQIPYHSSVMALQSLLHHIITQKEWMRNCDLLLLSRGKQQTALIQRHPTFDNLQISPVQAYFGNWSYAVTKRSARKLLNKVGLIDQQLDWKLSSLAKRKEIIIHGTNLPLFATRNLVSTTQSCQHWNGKEELYTLVE